MSNEAFPRRESPLAHDIVLHDESLRDGEQTCGLVFSAETKIDLARRLQRAGVKYMSLGFPAVSEADREAIRVIVREADDTSGFSCLARSRKEDIEAVVACEIPEVALFIPISDIHLRHKIRMTEDAAYDQMVSQIELARSFGLRVRFAFEDASRTPLERLKRFAVGALEAGATKLTIPDTSGILTPLTAYRLVSWLRDLVGGEAICAHFHNDLGLGTANSLMALAAGAHMAQGTLAGIGERAGNTCIEELAVALRTKYDRDLGIDLPALLELSDHVRGLADFPKAQNRPLVGEYAFAHESGIHVNGIMREATTYEPFPPELIGKSHEVRFGKHAGISNVLYAAEKVGVELGKDQAEAVLAEIKRRAFAGQKVEPAAVDRLIREHAAKPAAPAAAE